MFLNYEWVFTTPVLNCIFCIWNVDASLLQLQSSEALIPCFCEVCYVKWLQHSPVLLKPINLMIWWILVAWEYQISRTTSPLQLEQWMENSFMSQAFIKLPLIMPIPTSLFFSLQQRNHLAFCLSSVAREGRARTYLPRRKRPYVVLTVPTTRLDRWAKREQKTKEQSLKVRYSGSLFFQQFTYQ